MPKLDYKKILLIAGFLLVVVGVGIALYFVFFKKAPPVVIPPEEALEPGELKPSEPSGLPPSEIVNVNEGQEPSAGVASAPVTKIPAEVGEEIDTIAQGDVTQVTDLEYQRSLKPTASADGNSVLTYQPDTGLIYNIDSKGNKQAVSDKSFPDVRDIAWHPEKNQAILEFPDGANILYNFESDHSVTLPSTWTEFEFNSDGSKIAFKDLDPNPEYRWLAYANPDGTEARYLEHLGNNQWQVDVNWSPNGQIVGLYTTSQDSSTSKTYMLSKNQEDFEVLYTRGQNVEAKWSPSGDQLLYSAYSAETNFMPQLFVTDASGASIGENHRAINVNTWVDKCTFSDNSTVYCAVPRGLEYGMGFSPDAAADLPDDIYIINLKNGFKTKIATPQFNYTVKDMFVSDNGNYLYFTESSTGSLHEIRLK